MVLISGVVYVVSFLLLQALSRYREFAADRGSAIITGRPSALILGAAEDRGNDGSDPAARPPRRHRASWPPSTSSRRRSSRPWRRCSPPTRRSRPGSRRCPVRVPAPGHRPLGARRPGMGFLDILTGRRKLAGPAPDRLFAISTAYVTFETGLEITSRGTAAIVFQPLATADFSSIVRETEEVVRATASDSATTVENSTTATASAGWCCAAATSTDLVVGINAVSERAPGRRLRRAAAVLGVRLPRWAERALYWIYNYKRGFFYPFVPPAARSSATTSASLSSRPRRATSFRSSRSSADGSRCGVSPSDQCKVGVGVLPNGVATAYRCARLRNPGQLRLKQSLTFLQRRLGRARAIRNGQGDTLRILILGGDGFCGWPTTLHLSASGHDVAIVDNLARRKADVELEAESLTPITPIGTRLAAWRELTGREIPFHHFNVAENYRVTARPPQRVAARGGRAFRRAARRAVLDEELAGTSATRSTTTSTRPTTCSPRWSRPSSTSTSSTSARWASTATAPPA